MKTLFAVLLAVPLALPPAVSIAKTSNRHCWCVQNGPQGGCQRWTCRNIHKPVPRS